MTVRDFLKMLERDDDITVCYEAILEDGSPVELEQINGFFMENLSDQLYWVDCEYESETLEDGEDRLIEYAVLLTADELLEAEVVNFRVDYYDLTIRVRA